MATARVAGKPRVRAKVTPVARIIQPPPYTPELDALGLKLTEDGQVVAAVDCPDRPPHEILADPRAIVDARLWEGRFERGRLRESRVTERLDREQLGQRYTRLRETLKLTESDWFALGGGYGYGGAPESALTSNYVPIIPGPWTRQQYWADYWQSSAKCFEASTHSGIARRACAAMVHFPLGRGVTWDIQDDQARAAWEMFWKLNRMRRRFRSIFYDLAVFGEQMLRYFPAEQNGNKLRAIARGRSLIVRQIDPATIYEIVTDQEDAETVYFYHQQFQTRMELYSPPKANQAPQGPTPSGVTRYIVRQIDAGEVDHYRIHTVSGEVRGRSDLFPALGDLKRLRDLLTSKVIQSDIGNRVMAILKAKGTGADINRVLNTIFPNGQPPAPGTIVGLNDQTDLTPFQYTAGREVRADFTYDELVDGISAATGIARQYLGLAPSQGGSGSTRANALTAVEPSVKTFEERQDVGEEMLHEMFDRVMAQAGINGEIEREFTFPEIAKEDSTTRLENLEIAQANNWLSHRSAASMAAGEFDLADYDYDEEQQQIVDEFKDADETDGKDELTGADKPAQGGKIRRRMIRATARQAPMLDPTKSQAVDDEPLGMAIGPNGQPAAGAGGGEPAEQNPASGAGRANIRRAMREANRRRPDDPEFQEASQSFAEQTAQNLDRLLADLKP